MKKVYDGSPTIKWTGQDCHSLELGMIKFVEFFKRDNETTESFAKMRQIVALYNLFADLAR